MAKLVSTTEFLTDVASNTTMSSVSGTPSASVPEVTLQLDALDHGAPSVAAFHVKVANRVRSSSFSIKEGLSSGRRRVPRFATRDDHPRRRCNPNNQDVKRMTTLPSKECDCGKKLQ